MPSCGTEGKRQKNESVAADFNMLIEKATVVSIEDYKMRKNH